MRTSTIRPCHVVGRTVLAVGIGWLLGLSLVHLSESALETLPATEVSAASLSTQNSPDPATFQHTLHNYRTGRAPEAINELVLTYTPDGVSRSGRHTLSVNLTRAKGDIVARPGYWVSSR